MSDCKFSYGFVIMGTENDKGKFCPTRLLIPVSPPAEVVPPRLPVRLLERVLARELAPRLSPKLFCAADCPNKEDSPPPIPGFPPKPEDIIEPMLHS